MHKKVHEFGKYDKKKDNCSSVLSLKRRYLCQSKINSKYWHLMLHRIFFLSHACQQVRVPATTDLDLVNKRCVRYAAGVFLVEKDKSRVSGLLSLSVVDDDKHVTTMEEGRISERSFLLPHRPSSSRSVSL